MIRINYKSIIFSLLIFISIAFNSKLSENPPLFLSNIIIGIICILFLILYLKKNIYLFVFDAKLTFFLWLLLTTIGILSFKNINVQSVYLKLTLLIFTYYTFSRYFSINSEIIPKILLGFCLGVGFSPYFQVKFSDISSLGISNRIRVDNLGNFNAYAFLIAISLIISLYLFPKVKSNLIKLLLLITQLPLILVLLLTMSRGGVFAFLVGVFIYNFSISKKTKIYILVFGLFIILLLYYFISYTGNLEFLTERFLNSDGDENFDSGRSIIYLILLNDIISSPITLLFGNGIGAINIDVMAENNIISAHNTYLDVIHAFGILGFGIFVYFLRNTYIKIKKMQKSSEKSLYMAIFSQIVFCFLYDSYWGATQIGWIFSFMFALFYVNINSSKSIKLNL
jgi:O-antigen ligase